MPIVNMLVFANYAHFSKNMQKIKTLLDSGFSAVDSGFQFNGFHSLSVGRGFWIQNVSGILDSKARGPDSIMKISQIWESGFPCMGRVKEPRSF